MTTITPTQRRLAVKIVTELRLREQDGDYFYSPADYGRWMSLEWLEEENYGPDVPTRARITRRGRVDLQNDWDSW